MQSVHVSALQHVVQLCHLMRCEEMQQPSLHITPVLTGVDQMQKKKGVPNTWLTEFLHVSYVLGCVHHLLGTRASVGCQSLKHFVVSTEGLQKKTQPRVERKRRNM